ncbi:MAG: fumarate hydratase C-terminal domain-containing protein [Candidatus Omnitrophica bacterium]|nr:fumarate hydratase C-terminal domain-containing protein [Candidatus Omnitrophota bacterium]
MKKFFLPLFKEDIKKLRIGDEVLLSGIVYTARDQAHKRLVDWIKKRRRLPVDLKGASIYYCGPTKTKPGRVIGSCGPTTSSRMDPFTAQLFKAGLKVMIGKGKRSREVIDAIKRHNAVYFVTIGGAGAYLSKRVKKARLVAFKDLGPEAIYELEISDFPAIVWNK